jgi:predicted transcriptional regulator
MEVVWDLEDVTVRDVHSRLQASRAIAYTTVMTTLGRLTDKGLVKRIEEQPAHRYQPLLSRDQYARSTVKSVVDWLIGHFPDPAVSYFVDRVEKEDERVIERLRKVIDERRSDEA